MAIAKRTIFALLVVNLAYYLVLDVQYYLRFGVGESLGVIAEGFSASIEYVCWLVVILAFETEMRISQTG